MLSMKPDQEGVGEPGRISGSDTVVKVAQRSARRVCEASSSVGLTPSTTPISTRNATGVKAKSWASSTPWKP